MKWPPYLLKLRFRNRRCSFALWLPLFLIGPVVLVFLLAICLIMLPFALLTVLFTWRLGWCRPVVFGVPALGRLVCSLPGLKVDVASGEGQVFIAFQ